MIFEIVESNVLKIFKVAIQSLGGCADHYYLAEIPSLHNSLGWGSSGIELRGKVRITSEEFRRLKTFLLTSRYSISVNNCEHFANYVLYGINFSSQQHIWWKSLGAEIIESLQPTQSNRENYNRFICEQAANVLAENLRQAKIERANQEGIEFWKSRGINVT